MKPTLVGVMNNGHEAKRSERTILISLSNIYIMSTVDSYSKDLLTMWDFLEHKRRTGNKCVVLQRKNAPENILVMPGSCRSRYFKYGRLNISRKIRKRLGKYSDVPGLMETLTYDPKKISIREGWSAFGKDTRRFLNAVNQYRKRKGWQRTHYLWVVEVQKETGYPHVHIFFPNLKYLADIDVLNRNWSKGRANVSVPKKIEVNCAGYISKYLRKMKGWDELYLALLWSGKCRLYSFSRGFSAKLEKKESEWQRLFIRETANQERLKISLEEGGYTVENKGVDYGE